MLLHKDVSFRWNRVGRVCSVQPLSNRGLHANVRAARENTHTAQTALVFFHLLLLHSKNCSSQDLRIFSLALSGSGLCIVCRAHTFLDFVGTVLSPCVTRRQYSEVNPHTAHCKHSAVLWLQKTLFTGHEPKFKVDGSQKLTDEKRPSHAASSGRKSLKKCFEQFPFSTSSVPSDQFEDTVEITIPPALQVDSASRWESNADALRGPR